MKFSPNANHDKWVMRLKRCFFLLVSSWLIIVPTGRLTAQNQENKTNNAPTDYIFGSKHCTGCHDQPAKQTPNSRMNEWLTWHHQDRHRIAFDWFDEASRLSPVGQRAHIMAQNLGISDLKQAKQCTVCHSVPVEANVPTSYFDKPEERAREGVTCVSCHGTSREWVVNHVAYGDPVWKNASDRERWEKFGLVNLKNPLVQAGTCISCHVGDADPKVNRRITHEMYVAGHPPLPGIEVAMFTRQEPRHWLVRDESDQIPRKTANAIDLLAVSGLVTLKSELELLRQEMRESPESGILDFAQFDCQACHHSVSRTSQPAWRQIRTGHSVQPGRPRLPQWPRQLVRLGLIMQNPQQWQANEKWLNDQFNRLETSLAGSPSGHQSQEIVAELDNLIVLINGWLERCEKQWMQKGKLEPDSLTDTLTIYLGSLIDDQKLNQMDYHAARQIGWALKTMTDHDSKMQSDERMKKCMKDLDQILGLELRDDGIEETSPVQTDQNPQPVAEFLAERLNRISRWNPKTFHSIINEINELYRTSSDR